MGSVPSSRGKVASTPPPTPGLQGGARHVCACLLREVTACPQPCLELVRGQHLLSPLESLKGVQCPGGDTLYCPPPRLKSPPGSSQVCSAACQGWAAWAGSPRVAWSGGAGTFGHLPVLSGAGRGGWCPGLGTQQPRDLWSSAALQSAGMSPWPCGHTELC